MPLSITLMMVSAVHRLTLLQPTPSLHQHRPHSTCRLESLRMTVTAAWRGHRHHHHHHLPDRVQHLSSDLAVPSSVNRHCYPAQRSMPISTSVTWKIDHC